MGQSVVVSRGRIAAANTLPFFESLVQDARYALRQVRKSPGFAFAATLTLALGIGATTAIYSLVDGVLLRPLPLPHPERLVAVTTLEAHGGQDPDWDATSYPNYLDWRARNHTFAGLAAVVPSSRSVSQPNGTSAEIVSVNRVSANYFDVLGVQPTLGRNFALDEDQAGRHIAIISHGYWQRIFAGDSHALGSTVMISDVPYTIIGVMPKGFVEPRPESADLWTTFALYLEGTTPAGKERKEDIAEIVGRLSPAVTVPEAQADLSAIQSDLAQTYSENRFRTAVAVQTKLTDLTGDIRPALLWLMAAVLAVLLIACTNVAGLILSRTMRRRSEMALRTALGASRWQVWRQLLIESLLLGLFGGTTGIGLAYGLLHLVLPLVPGDIPRLGEVSLDTPVLSFSLIVSLACAMVTSVFPAWKLARAQPVEALREQGQSATAGKQTLRFQNILVIGQTALGFALLIASGLLIRGFVNVRHVDTGFKPEHLFDFMVPLTPVRYPNARKVLFYDELLPRLAALPGVRSVSGGYPLPLQGSYNSVTLEIDGRSNAPDHPLTTLVGVAEPGFFETLDIPLLRGRNLTLADNNLASPFVVIVNQAFAKRFFPNENAVGRHIRPDLNEAHNNPNDFDRTANRDREIVGVVADVQQSSITDPPEPFAVFPFAQASTLMRPTVVLRVAGEPMRYEKSAQAIVSELDSSLFMNNPSSMTTRIVRISSSQRFETMLISAFAGTALSLTGLGLYATLAAMVAARSREIGLRMAVGAERKDVAVLVLNRAATLLLVGLCLGSAVALTASRSLHASDWWRPLLFGVSWFEPQTYVAILVVLGIVSMAACLLPTWRAMHVDPMQVLRDQ